MDGPLRLLLRIPSILSYYNLIDKFCGLILHLHLIAVFTVLSRLRLLSQFFMVPCKYIGTNSKGRLLKRPTIMAEA